MAEGYVVFDIETTGLNPWYDDRITCISAKDDEGNWFSEVCNEFKNERYCIRKFIFWLREKEDKLLVTKNGKGFDIPFILSRLSKPSKRIDIILVLALSVFKKEEHFDLQEITSKYISLKDMAKLFSCEPKSGDGISAIKLWEEKRYDELKSYCEQDVNVTEQVYLKYKSLQEVQ